MSTLSELSPSDVLMDFLPEMAEQTYGADMTQTSLLLESLAAQAACKRVSLEPEESEGLKRRKLYVNALAPSLARKAMPSMDMHDGSAVFGILEPFCHSGGGGKIVLHDGFQCRQLSFSKLHERCMYGGSVAVCIPSSWQPTIRLPVHGSARIAKLNVDWQGTITLLSAEGELLAQVAAVRCLEDANFTEVVRIDLHGVQQMPRESDEVLLGAMHLMG